MRRNILTSGNPGYREAPLPAKAERVVPQWYVVAIRDMSFCRDGRHETWLAGSIAPVIMSERALDPLTARCLRRLRKLEPHVKRVAVHWGGRPRVVRMDIDVVEDQPE